MGTLDVKVNAVIPEELRERIRAVASERGTTVQSIVAALIRNGFKIPLPTKLQPDRRYEANAKRRKT